MKEKIVYACNLNCKPTPASCVNSFWSDIVGHKLCDDTECPCVHREKYEITPYRKWDDVTNIKKEEVKGESDENSNS